MSHRAGQKSDLLHRGPCLHSQGLCSSPVQSQNVFPFSFTFLTFFFRTPLIFRTFSKTTFYSDFISEKIYEGTDLFFFENF